MPIHLTPLTPGGSHFLTVAQARARVRAFARNAKDSDNYEDEDIDFAIQHVINDFAGETTCLRRTDTVDLADGSSAVDASSIDGFRRSFLVAAWIVDVGDLTLMDHQSVRNRLKGSAQSGEPQLLGWADATSGNVWPTPDDSYELTLDWTPPATVWTAGDDDDVLINIPADLLIPILTYGATAALQHNEVKHRYASESWKKYEQFKSRHMNAGGGGAQTTDSDPLI